MDTKVTKRFNTSHTNITSLIEVMEISTVDKHKQKKPFYRDIEFKNKGKK